MAANSLVHPTYYKRTTPFTRWVLKLRYPRLDWLPRRDILASVVLLLAGFGLPCLMVLELLPTNFWLAFLGLALAAVGGCMALVRCGEI